MASFIRYIGLGQKADIVPMCKGSCCVLNDWAIDGIASSYKYPSSCEVAPGLVGLFLKERFDLSPNCEALSYSHSGACHR